MSNDSKPDIKFLRLSKRLVEETFDECNSLYFDGNVEKPIKFETWTPYPKTVGMVRPVKMNGKNYRVKSIMHISRRYRWTEENLRKVVVHEMIHLAVGDYKEFLTFWQRLPLIGRWFITEHGKEFKAMMNDLNERFGLGIKIRIKKMRSEFIK